MDLKLIIGREGAQTQPITDMGVSRKHLSMEYCDDAGKPYLLQLLNSENSLRDGSREVVRTKCNSASVIYMGKNKVQLDMQSAIKDLESLYRKAGMEPPYVSPAGTDESGSIQEPPGTDPVDRDWLENMRVWYEKYEKFQKRSMIQAVAVKMSGSIPAVLFILSRVIRTEKGTPTWLLALILVTLLVTVILNIWYGSYAKKKSAEFNAAMRMNYGCPMNRKLTMYMDRNRGVYVPYDKLEDGMNCELCCHTNCKRHK